MNKQLLETRLSIIMVKEGKNFLSSFLEYQKLLLQYFEFEYSLDEIENALHRIEESTIEEEFQKNREIIEIEEDNFNN